MSATGWLGDKAGQGFYKKSARRGRQRTADWCSISRRWSIGRLAKAALPALEMAKNAGTVKERLQLLLAGDPAKDKAAKFLWPFLSTLWNFSADRIGEAADDAASIDRAMRAGFNWELGPFEMWDAAGVAIDRCTHEVARHCTPARVLKRFSRRASASWYSTTGRACFQSANGEAWEAIAAVEGHARVADFRRANGVVRSNAGASLVDLGDGIGCIELHSLKNAIGGDVVAMISAVLQSDSDAVRRFCGIRD